MKVHFFQHVEFEGLGNIANWVERHRHTLTGTRFYLGERPPALDDIELLIIMGGPMSVNDEALMPWMREEKEAIAEAIALGKKILGVCLGAQLIADVLGAKVIRAPHKEVGWFPVALTPEGQRSRVTSFLPDSFIAMHWHGEMFGIPAEAKLLASTPGCPNQAFSYGENERIVGLQFHLDLRPDGVQALARNCASDLAPGEFIQSEAQMMQAAENFGQIEEFMAQLLDQMCGLCARTTRS